MKSGCVIRLFITFEKTSDDDVDVLPNYGKHLHINDALNERLTNSNYKVPFHGSHDKINYQAGTTMNIYKH